MSRGPTRTATTTLTTVSFEDILDDLERLTRTHLLVYRVQVGAVLLGHFWDDDPAAFSNRSPHRTQRFDLFFDKYAETLTRYGLSRRMARDSIRACIVMRSLPSELAEQLFLSQVLLLATVHDKTLRARLAQAAVRQDWSVVTLRKAVTASRAGLPFDLGNPSAAAELPAPEAIKPMAPGRLVTRAEKLSDQVRGWTAQWATVDPSRLRGPQRERLAAAVTELEAEVAKLRASLETSS